MPEDPRHRIVPIVEPLTGVLWVVVATGCLALVGLGLSYLVAALF